MSSVSFMCCKKLANIMHGVLFTDIHLISYFVFRKSKKAKESTHQPGMMAMQRMPNSAVVNNEEALYDDTYHAQNLYTDTMQRMPNSAVVNNEEGFYDDTYHTQDLYEAAAPVRDQLYATAFSANSANASTDVYAVPDKNKKSALPDDLPDETEIIDNELYGVNTDMRQTSKPQNIK